MNRPLGIATVIALICAGAALLAKDLSSASPAILSRTPGELIRTLRDQLAGYEALDAAARTLLDPLQRHFERPVPPDPLPDLGKGAGVTAAPAPVPARALQVASTAHLVDALAQALPGDQITLQPGVYRIEQRLAAQRGGTAQQPIVLRAARLGEARLEVLAGTGVLVSAPFWRFENLQLRGACSADDDCEHAFHIVGQARGTVLHNNEMREFSAHIKVNGQSGHWPDDGVVAHNSLLNSRPRVTQRPVTAVDIVGASGWVVADNRVQEFAKSVASQTSYGIFMKGGGSGGRIERNLFICSSADISAPGTRVGISLGGGGTGAPYCRNGQCLHEHSQGLIANNIVAHCNDSGIDVNRSQQVLVAHNTLINTAGIDVRGAGANAELRNNLLEGRLRARQGGSLQAQGNAVGPLREWLDQADRLSLAWREAPAAVPALPALRQDFCGRLRDAQTSPGAGATPCPTLAP